MKVEEIPTYQLVEILKQKEGVESFVAEPYEDKKISVNGPATILVIID